MTTLLNNCLNKFWNWYKFDVTDIVAVLYGICVIGILQGLDMNLLFVIAVAVSLCANLRCGRLNILVINGLFLVLDLFYLFH